MGIYIAVFVARCCEDLVEGVSKGKVTAGLIGGRLVRRPSLFTLLRVLTLVLSSAKQGNKGGVGISLHFASSRLLFISAHLAAHASGLEIRKANALKIFEELDVDDFWEASGKVGPKPKELTERFDQTLYVVLFAFSSLDESNVAPFTAQLRGRCQLPSQRLSTTRRLVGAREGLRHDA